MLYTFTHTPGVVPWQAGRQVYPLWQFDGGVLQGVDTNVDAAISNRTVNHLCMQGQQHRRQHG